MNAQDKQTPLDHLVTAYERMLERVHAAVERAEHQVPSLKQSLEQARDKAVELGELTREEAERIASYMERDLRDAAAFIVDTGQEIQDWWRFDLEQVEQRMLELFASVADQTRLQWQEITEQWRQTAVYSVGEVTGPGALVCSGCGQAVDYVKPERIQPCPRCQGTRFHRQVAEDTQQR